MISDKLSQAVRQALGALGLAEVEFSVEPTDDLAHGDYATNAALVAARVAGSNPRELAAKLSAELAGQALPEVARIEAAGPGFLNFHLAPDFCRGELARVARAGERYGWGDRLAARRVLVEYTDPNPFKVFHIGHLMANAIGEAISRLIEAQGAVVRRACYQGDVGRHVAITIWALRFMPEPFPSVELPLSERVAYLGRAYTLGVQKFETEPGAAEAVGAINRKIYERSDPEVNEIYDLGREWSLQYFEEIYRRLGTKFDRYFFESAMSEPGLALVREFLAAGVFAESDGAVVFRGESQGLHTRVFINSQGLPTYETKELGLTKAKFEWEDWDESVVVTASEQRDYFRVVLAALRVIKPEWAARTTHLTHGMMRLPSGKMSSRKGNVITGESLLAEMEERAAEKLAGREIPPAEERRLAQEIAVGAIKYSILKQSPGKDIIFDPEKSLSFEGDSGPYLQYTHTRARSVLAKAGSAAAQEEAPEEVGELERLLVRFPEVVARASADYAPQQLLSYLTSLASAFNAYYAQHQIIGSAHEAYRLELTRSVAQVLKNGLWLLGIPVPERM